MKKLTRGVISGVALGALSEVGATVIASVAPSFKKLSATMKDPELMGSMSLIDVLQPLFDDPITSLVTGIGSRYFEALQPLCAGVAVFGLAMGLLSRDKEDKPEDAAEYGAHGSARWAEEHEIFEKEPKKKKPDKPPVDITTSLEESGIILAKYAGKLIKLRDKSWKNKNVAIFGGSGAGKSKSIIIPNILNTTDRSIVVTDPKGELYELTSETKRAQGYDVRLVNFKDRYCSDRYNFMDYIKEPSDARKVAQNYIENTMASGQKPKGDFWDKAEASLISAFLLYVKYVLPESKQHPGSVFEMLKADYKEIDILFRSLDEYHIARRAYDQAISKLEDKTRSSVFTTACVTWDLWKYPDVCEFTYTSDFKFEDIGLKKMIVYVVIPVAEDDFVPLISTFFTQMFTELYALADRHFNELPVPVSFLMDEFNNVGKVPRFESRLSTTRSYGISVMMIIQSMGQLIDRWGKNKADEIIDNCDTRIFLGANNNDTPEYFSKLIGKTTIKVQTGSNSHNSTGSSESTSYSYIGRSLITPEEMRELPDNMAIVLIKGKKPMLVGKAWYDQIEDIKKLLTGTVSRYDYEMEDRTIYNVLHVPTFVEEIKEQIKQQEEEKLQEIMDAAEKAAKIEEEYEEANNQVPDQTEDEEEDIYASELNFIK